VCFDFGINKPSEAKEGNGVDTGVKAGRKDLLVVQPRKLGKLFPVSPYAETDLKFPIIRRTRT